jgi:hypothetical protein
MGDDAPRFPWPGDSNDLVSRAAAMVEREAKRFSGGSLPGVPAVSSPDSAGAPLQQQAHELLASILAAFGQAGGGDPGAGMGGRRCPVTRAAVPVGPFDKDRIRQQAHAFIETLLITFNEATGERGLPAENKVPHLQAEAPVAAGGEARAGLVVSNDEAGPADVSLYCSNFVSDAGHEIPALRVSVVPRRATIPPGGEAAFQIRVAVPAQTPAGVYSGLVQAMGAKYVKAVLSVEVS